MGPERLDQLSTKQVIIGLSLQNEEKRGNLVDYILGRIDIRQLARVLNADFQRFSFPTHVTDVSTNIFTEERSFFHILRQLVQFLNGSEIPRVNRDSIERYLGVYETIMKNREQQFRYMNLPSSIYVNIKDRLHENLSIEEKLIFSILGEDRELLDIRRIISEANEYWAFTLAAEHGRIDILKSLWKNAELLSITRAMLKVNNYEAFKLAAQNGHIGILNFLWQNAESFEGAQRAMLEYNDYEAFKRAAYNGHRNALELLLTKARSFNGGQALTSEKLSMLRKIKRAVCIFVLEKIQ